MRKRWSVVKNIAMPFLWGIFLLVMNAVRVVTVFSAPAYTVSIVLIVTNICLTIGSVVVFVVQLLSKQKYNLYISSILRLWASIVLLIRIISMVIVIMNSVWWIGSLIFKYYIYIEHALELGMTGCLVSVTGILLKKMISVYAPLVLIVLFVILESFNMFFTIIVNVYEESRIISIPELFYFACIVIFNVLLGGLLKNKNALQPE